MNSTNSKASDPLKLIKTMRALYKESKRKSFDEEKRTWDNIVKICNTHKINTDIVIMEDFAFDEMTIPIIECYIQNSK